jgi:transposase
MSESAVVEQSVLVDVEPLVLAPVAPKLPVDKTFRVYDQDQPMLLPPDLRDWLASGHPARMIDDLVEHGLDLSVVYAGYTEVRGAPPYDPRLMLKILIYGYSHGVTSSRALERRCHDDVAFRFLTAQAAPDFVAIARFRTRHGAALKQMFVQSLALCAKAGLVSLGRVALDGTKLRASASRHRAMSYDRMVRAEAELAAEVEQLVAEAERIDAAEDASYGSDRRGDELPAELTRRQDRLAVIRKAKAALEAEYAAAARVKAEQTAGNSAEPAADNLAEPIETAADNVAEDAAAPVAVVPEVVVPEVVVPDKAQRSFTDPDARIMKTSDGSFHYCYNAQAIVDERSQVVLAAALRQSGADCPALPVMLGELAASLAAAGIEGSPRTLLADAGYFSADNIAAVIAAGIDPLIATGRLKHGQQIPPAPRGRIPNGQSAKQLMARKLRTKKGKADYARRKAIVEPVFGQVQVAQNGDHLRLRGTVKADFEYSFHLACHNFRKLFASGWTPAQPALA